MEMEKSNPMLNDVFLRRFFGYCSVDELMTCRQVCSKWWILSQPFVERNCNFLFGFEETTRNNSIEDNDLKMADCFLNILQKCADNDFTFRFDYSLSGHFEGMADVIENNIEAIANLKIEAVRNKKKCTCCEMEESSAAAGDNTFSGCDPMPPFHDLSPIITKGHLKSIYIDSSRISISIDCLVAIESITLHHCTIILSNSSTKLTPNTFNLNLNEFKKDEVILDVVTVNDFLDVRKIKKLELNYYQSRANPIVKFDGRDRNICLDLLKVGNYYSIEWADLNCRIKRLEVTTDFDLSILHNLKPSVDVREMLIGFAEDMTEISWMPKSLEKLTLFYCENWSKEPAHFPDALFNLKYLWMLSVTTIDVSFLHHYGGSMPNLEVLKVGQLFEGEVLNLNLEFIPQNVKQIELWGNIRIEENNTPIPLHSLALIRYSNEDVDDLFRCLSPQNLVINFYMEVDYTSRIHEIFEKYSFVKRIIAIKTNFWRRDGKPPKKSQVKFFLFDKEKMTYLTTKDFKCNSDLKKLYPYCQEGW